MATPSFVLKNTLSYVRDTGATAQVTNDNTEYTLLPGAGYLLKQEITLAVGATNTAVTLAVDTAAVLVEEVTGADEGVLMKIGSTSATAVRLKKFMVWPPLIDTVGLAASTVLYFTSEAASEIKIAITTINTDA